MRLIDADAVELGFDELCRSPYFKHDVNAKHGAETLMDVCVRTDSHMPNTIDPETIPVVRQLREELTRVTAERDAAVKDLETAMRIDSEADDMGLSCFLCHVCIKNDTCDGACNPKWRGPNEEATP